MSGRLAGTAPLLAAAAYAAAVVIWIGQDPRAARSSFPPGSALSTADDGLSLARAYLEARAERVSLLSRSVAAGELEADAVVLRIQPWSMSLIRLLADELRQEQERQRKRRRDDSGTAQDEDEPDAQPAGDEAGSAPAGPAVLLSEAEQAWLRGGGRLVVALSSRYGPLEAQRTTRKEGIIKSFPTWPGVSRIEVPKQRVLAGPPLLASQTLAVLGDEPAASRWPVGAGELLVLSFPEVLHNGHIEKAHHLALLEALAGRGRPVYFDEHAHGLGRELGLTALLGRWGLGPFLALLAATAAAALWRGSSRIGPPEDVPAPLRSEAVDLVESLGQLYARSLSRQEALELYRQALVREVAIHTGLGGEALAERVLRLAGAAPEPAGRRPSAEELRHELDRINSARRRLAHVHRG